jgi:hypothetical protein
VGREITSSSVFEAFSVVALNGAPKDVKTLIDDGIVHGKMLTPEVAGQKFSVLLDDLNTSSKEQQEIRKILMDNATQLLNLGEEALSSEDVDKLHAPGLTGKAKDDLKLHFVA